MNWQSWTGLAIALLIALAAAGIVLTVTTLTVRSVAKYREWPSALGSSARFPFRALVVLTFTWIAVSFTLPDEGSRPLLAQVWLIAFILAAAWLASALINFAIGISMSRYRVDVPDNKVARGVRTQLAIVRRLASVTIAILALGAVLLTFPGVEAVGASVLASAGVVSIIAGLAAQSTLSNVIAGVQLAFSGAIRVEDVVVVQGQWGRIEEITLTYVVVHVWDDRRLVLPSSYFATTPFENWTRNSSQLIGEVLLDVDWNVSVSAMRAELDAILASTELWDERSSVLQVTDAVGGVVQVRVLVSAPDAGALWDLRCVVREHLVEWVREKNPASLPRTRVQLVEDEKPPKTRPAPTEPAGLFTGSKDAEQRHDQFTSGITIVGQSPDERPLHGDPAE